MQRYTVTIVTPPSTTATGRPTLLVPFQPTASVKAFIAELWKRVQKQNLPIAPNTHIATLHIDSETDAIIDADDTLADVVDPTHDSLFAVYAQKADTITQTAPLDQSTSSTTLDRSDDNISVRIITPIQARDKGACPLIQISTGSTIRELHDQIAEHLKIHTHFEEDVELLECNCTLGIRLADGPCPKTSFLVVHGKSIVERLDLAESTELALKAALRTRFGPELEDQKRVELTNPIFVDDDEKVYKKPPVVRICSKHRHTSAYPDLSNSTDSSQRGSKVLDLHTSEQPIHPGCMGETIKASGLTGLVQDGVLDIYAVHRADSGEFTSVSGKGAVYRAGTHWEPEKVQSARGTAMFLSSLRVFASLVAEPKDDNRAQDAVLHVIDLLIEFKPAVRAFQMLFQNKTIRAPESAAISHTMFAILDSFMPLELIGIDRSRLFEGSRLLFAFILDQAQMLKLPEEDGAVMPYLNSIRSVSLQDRITNEAVMRAVHTRDGLLEASLWKELQEDGVLANSHLSSETANTHLDVARSRHALLSGGITPEVTILSTELLHCNYRYHDMGDIAAAIDPDHLQLDYLADLSGKVKLAVHKPSQVKSAVAPCLTFDRNAHLTVYTGEQMCAAPGKSSLIFRPMHGEEILDTGVVEQLIAPIIRGYESDGTAVFDSFGGAVVRRLHAPDEIIMFAVDVSQSMGGKTDFKEVNEELVVPRVEDNTPLVEPAFYNKASLDDVRERLTKYEGFSDMVAIVGEANTEAQRNKAGDVLEILRTLLTSEITEKAKSLTDRQQGARQSQNMRQQTKEMQETLDQLKTFWAGSKTHEEALCDFLIYRAVSTPHDICQQWTWDFNDSNALITAPGTIPKLPAELLEIPHELRCPISHTLMEYAVIAADGHTYSRAAIETWFTIRKSSPMTGLSLDDPSLQANQEIRHAAQLWIEGDGVSGHIPKRPSQSKSCGEIEVHFDCKVGTFSRLVSTSSTAQDVHRLAFRGLKGRFEHFQLSGDRFGRLEPSLWTVNMCTLGDGTRISIRIAEDEPARHVDPRTSNEHSAYVLIKVYDQDCNKMAFAYWVKKSDATGSLATVLWKYWRNKMLHSKVNPSLDMQIWTGMEKIGDSWFTGWPRDNTTKLATFFDRTTCKGILGSETVYMDENAAQSAAPGTPLVLKLYVKQRSRESKEHRGLTRLDILKQMFEALINRIEAYDYKTHVGLITFASSAEVKHSISHVLENFRRATNEMTALGDTALWDALALANDQLQEYAKQYPDVKKRIICISDGKDTKSVNNTAARLCWSLREAGIAIDTVTLGNESCEELDLMAHALGCYRFHPTSLANALVICEMEPFLSLSERPPLVVRFLSSSYPTFMLRFYDGFEWWNSKTTLVTADTVPPRKEHPNLGDDFIELSAAAAQHDRSPASHGSTSSRPNARIARLMSEMKRIAGSHHPTYDVYVSETDMSFWKVVLSGPSGTPYEGGTFLLYVHADDKYPTFAPKARFVTKIKHPNINMHGRICHSILDRDWLSDTSMTTLLDTIYGLLLTPEYSDPVNTTMTLSYHHDTVEFANEVRQFIERHASNTREWWREHILDPPRPEEDDEDHDEYENYAEDEQSDDVEMDDEDEDADEDMEDFSEDEGLENAQNGGQGDGEL